MLPEKNEQGGRRGKTFLKWGAVFSAVLLVFVILGGVKYFQIRAAMAGHMSFSMPPESVTTVVVVARSWPGVLTAVGSLKPVAGLVLRADLPGNVEAIGFESGARVKKGDLLVQQDVSEELAQLRAAEAKQRLAELNLARFQGLLAKRVSSQSDYDQSSAQFLEAKAKCEEIKAVIEKKTIRVPFDGLAGIRMVPVATPASCPSRSAAFPALSLPALPPPGRGPGPISVSKSPGFCLPLLLDFC